MVNDIIANMEAQILSAQEIEQQLQSLNVAWSAIGNDYLVRVVPITSYTQAAQLVASLAQLAETHSGSPKITIDAEELSVELADAQVAGITGAEFTFAKAIDAIIQ